MVQCADPLRCNHTRRVRMGQRPVKLFPGDCTCRCGSSYSLPLVGLNDCSAGPCLLGLRLSPSSIVLRRCPLCWLLLLLLLRPIPCGCVPQSDITV